MSQLINPYVAGNPVGGTKTFIGREELLAHALTVFTDSKMNTIVLYGQRRTGKTSIIQELRQRLPKVGSYVSIYFNLEDRANLPIERVLSDLAKAIIHEISDTSPRMTVLEKLTQPLLSKETFQFKFLPQALDALLPNSLVVLFDEFDVLGDSQLDQAAQMFFPYLHQLMTLDQQRLQFVFAIGRQFEDWPNLMEDIFREAELLRVSTLTHKETVGLVRLSEENKSLVWHKTAIERVWELTSGHPYLTQQLCAVVWDNIHQNTDKQSEQVPGVLPEMVDAAISKLFERSTSALEWLWNGLPPAARFVASVLAEAESDVVSQEELETTLQDHGVQVIMRQLRDAPQTLKEWDVIEEVDEGYRFRVELLRQWLVRHKQLARVREELEKIEPIANTRYQQGKEKHQAGDLGEAARHLRLAVQINPNHIKAHLELGKVLLKQQKTREAIAELKVAFESNPIEAKSEYIKALLKVAQSQEQTLQERWELCQQLLQIQPDHADALRVQVSLVQQREQRLKKASEYEKAENWAAVIPIYEQLLAYFPEEKEKWQESCQRARQQQDLENLYQQAQRALADGESKEAIEILSKLLLRQADYKQAQNIMVQALKDQTREETPSLINQTAIKWGAAIISLLFFSILGISVTNRLVFNSLSERPMLTRDTATATLEPTATAIPKTKTPTAESTFTGAATEKREFSKTVISESPDEVVVLLALSGHTGQVWSVDFSSDGYLLASGAHDNQIRLWDVATGHPLLILTDHTAKVWRIDFSPDSAFLASGSEETTIRLWDIKSSQALESLTGHAGPIRSVAFSSDGTRLASGADDKTVRLWDVATGHTQQTFSDPTDWVLSVAFSPDGTRLASGDADNTIYLWDIAREQLLQTLTDHTDWVRSIAFSPDGKHLASASNDNTVRLWNLADGEVQAVLEGHTKSVNSVAFSPDGTLLASGADDHTIRLWDVEGGILIKTLEDESGRVLSVAFNPDGTRLTSGSDSGTIFLWGLLLE
jgi:WD40 repeat protein/tetratricopeptide (TPR) repeat protein